MEASKKKRNKIKKIKNKKKIELGKCPFHVV